MAEIKNKIKIPIAFLLKILAVAIMVSAYFLFKEHFTADSILPQVVSGLNVFLIPSILLSVTRFIIIAVYNARHSNRTVRGNFVLGINRLTAVLNVLFAILALMILLGIDPRDFMTSLTIVAMAIAVIFREYITNMLSGLFVMFSEQLSVGDRIVVGEHKGRIVDITFANIVLQNEEDDIVMVPNNLVFTNPMVNLSAHRSNLFTVKFQLPLAAATEVEQLENEIQAVMNNHPNLDNDGTIALKVEEIGKDFVSYKVELYANSSSNKLHRQLENELLKSILQYERNNFKPA